MALLGLAGCDQPAEGSSAGGGRGDAPPPTVGVVTIKPETVDRIDLLPGRVVAYQVAEIRPQVSGIIQSRLFEEGSFVEEGQQLYQIDAARYEADLERAQGMLEEAEARLLNADAQSKRVEKLFKADSLSQEQYDEARFGLKEAKAAVRIAEANVRTAAINLDYTKVRSPISGFVGPSRVTKGALVTESQPEPLAIVRELDPVYVDLSKSVAESADLRERFLVARRDGDAASQFTVTLYPNRSSDPYPNKGTLDVAEMAVDPLTGSVRLRSVFPNPAKVLLPGMFVRASIATGEGEKAIVIPQKAVMIEPGGGRSVWLVDANTQAVKQPVRLGKAFGNKWIVEEGLESGDRLIVEGTMMLREGTKVQPRENDPES